MARHLVIGYFGKVIVEGDIKMILIDLDEVQIRKCWCKYSGIAAVEVVYLFRDQNKLYCETNDLRFNVV